MVRPGPETRVLDVGFNEREHSAVDNYIERRFPWPANLTALGLHEAVEFRQRYPQVRVVRYDGSIFPFADKAFDVVWSNAVIEHVGDFNRQVLFVREMARVAPASVLQHAQPRLSNRTPHAHAVGSLAAQARL